MKTGGTSLGLVLRDWFGDGYYNQYVDHQHLIVPEAVPLKDESGAYKQGICLHGHFINGTNNALDIYPDARQFVAFFRDPLEQVISSFHFQKRAIEEDGQIYFQKVRYTNPVCLERDSDRLMETDDLGEFVGKGRCTILNYLPFEFTVDNYKEIFETYFLHIGCHAYYQSSVEELARKLRKPLPIKWPHAHAGSYSSNIHPNIKDDFYRRHTLETELYEYSRSLYS